VGLGGGDLGKSVCLVTGGCGFIRQHLVRQLVERGDDVRVLDRRDGRYLPSGVDFVRGSILDGTRLRDACRGVDRVFHLAANPRLWARDKGEFERVNLHGTEAVLAEAERVGVARVVYTSTESILRGRSENEEAATTESVKTSPDDLPGPYCRSKFFAEQAALRAAERGQPVVIVNPTLPVGPGDWGLTPPTKMLLLFLNGGSPAYLEGTLNFVDVRDAALGHVLAAERGRAGERYILGGDNLTISELIALLHELTGLPMPRLRIPYAAAYAFAAISEFLSDHVTRRAPQAPITGVRLMRCAMAFDSSKARAELGWEPAPVRGALADAVDWFREQNLLKREIGPSVRHTTHRDRIIAAADLSRGVPGRDRH